MADAANTPAPNAGEQPNRPTPEQVLAAGQKNVDVIKELTMKCGDLIDELEDVKKGLTPDNRELIEKLERLQRQAEEMQALLDAHQRAMDSVTAECTSEDVRRALEYRIGGNAS